MPCDITPNISYGSRTVQSRLFPQIQEVVGDREQAKQIYEQAFDPNFGAWFGNWHQGARKPGKDGVSEKFDTMYATLEGDSPWWNPDDLYEIHDSVSNMLNTIFIPLERTWVDYKGTEVAAYNNEEVLKSLVDNNMIPDELLPLARYLQLNPFPGRTVFYGGLPDTAYMQYDFDRKYILFDDYSLMSSDSFAQAFLHEMMHHYTVHVYKDAFSERPLTDREKAFRKEVDGLFAEARRVLNDDGDVYYGLSEPVEFLAEVMANTEFANALKAHDLTLWEKILAAINRLFGVETKSGKEVYESATSLILEHIHSIPTNPPFTIIGRETNPGKFDWNSMHDAPMAGRSTPAHTTVSMLRHASGEPMLLSPVAGTHAELASTSPHFFHTKKPYGKGLYLKQASGESLQAGFAKVARPVVQGKIDTNRISNILTKKAGMELSEGVVNRIQALNDMSLADATRSLTRIVKDMEFETSRNIWLGMQDTHNIWQLFHYDGLVIDNENFVVFGDMDYWSAWNNQSAIQRPEHRVEPEEGVVNQLDGLTHRKQLLEQKFQAEVEYHDNLPGQTIARVRREGDRAVIEVHPGRIQSDTLFHEFAHIMIDGIGGVNNPQVKRGITLLRDTEIWREVAENNPELKGVMLQKEVLATVMGREALELHINDQNLLGQIKNWLSLLMDRIRKVFGLPVNEARALSREMLSTQTTKEFDISGLPANYQYQKKRTDRSVRNLNRKLKVYEDMFDRMNQRIAQLQERGDKLASRDLARIVKELQKDLDRKVGYTGLIHYVNQAYQDLDYLYTHLHNAAHKGTLTPEQLVQIRNAADTYSTLTAVDRMAIEDPDIQKELGADLMQTLDHLRHLLERIETTFQEEAFEFSVDFLSGNRFGRDVVGVRRKRTEIENRFREDFRRKYSKKRDYQGREDQYRIDEESYIQRRMESEKTEVEAEIENDLREQLKMMQQDVGSIESWMTALKNLDFEVLQVVAEAVDHAEHRVIQDTFEMERETHKVLEPLRKHKNRPASPEKLFEDILEVGSDGKLTGYVISEYTSEFAELERQFYESRRELSRNDYDAFIADKIAFYREHGKKNPAYMEWAKRRNEAEKKLSQNEYENWKFENKAPREYLPADKYRNKQYNKLNPEHSSYLGDNHPVTKFYNFTVHHQNRFDDMLGMDSKRLGYRLPAIRKNVVERIVTGDLANLKENIRSGFFWAADDTSAGEIVQETNEKGEKVYVRRDARGKRIENIPIHYRAELDTKDQSFDVASLILLNGHTSMNYAYKNQILPEIQLIQEQIREARVGQYRGGQQQMMKDSKTRPYTIRGELSKSYKALDQFIDHRMYGRHTTENDPFVDHAKKFGQVMSYTGMLLLGGNVLAGVANVALGESLFLAEAAASRFLDMKDWRAAQGYYARHMGNGEILGDIGRHRYESVVNLLMKQYDALNTYHPWSHKFADRGRIMRMFRQHNIYALNNIGEHRMHTMTLFALLHRIKVTNENGEWINRDGKVTKNRKEAATLLEMYRAEDGELILDNKVKKVEWDGKYYTHDSNLQFRITQRMRQLNEYMHGAYADQNSNYLQRFTMGRMAIMMRKWIEPGIRRRFAGIKGAWYGKKGMRWDHQLNDFHEGTATTFARWWLEAWRNNSWTDFIYALQANWRNMNDYERANVHRMVMEVAIMLPAFVFARAMYSMAKDTEDENEANRYWYMGYQANRLFSEMFFYYPPFNLQEAYRVLKSPAATIAVWERSGRLIRQMFDPFDEYESGRRHGDLKIGKYARDMVPFYGPVDRIRNMADLVNIVYNP